MSKEKVEGKGRVKRPSDLLIEDLKNFYNRIRVEEGARRHAGLEPRINELNHSITDHIHSFGDLNNFKATIFRQVEKTEFDVTNIDPLLGALLPPKLKRIIIPGMYGQFYPTKYKDLYIQRDQILIDILGTTGEYSLVGKNYLPNNVNNFAHKASNLASKV